MSDKTTLLLSTVCGAIGVIVIICAVGSTIGPPQDKLYAVEPVDVLIKSPSPENSSKNSLSFFHEYLDILLIIPLCAKYVLYILVS